MLKKICLLLKRNLATQILIGLILGIVIGVFLNYVNSNSEHFLFPYYKSLIVNFFKPLGDILISLIKMIVIPIIITTLIVGIGNLESTKTLGTMGLKSLLYFEIITTIAIFVGIFSANIFKPGTGINRSLLETSDYSHYQNTLESIQDQPHGIVAMVLDLIPTNVVYSMANGDLLPIIFFSVLFGIGVLSLPRVKREALITVFSAMSETMFSVTNIVMRYAPIGVFGLITVTVAQYGFSALLSLFKLVFLVYATMIFFVFVVLGAVAYIFNFNLFTIIKLLRDELILAFSTASSEAVLPKLMEKTEKYGASKSVASFVLPTGYSFNLDGSTLYQSIAVLFIAQLYQIDLSLLDQIAIVITLMIASKGIAGVPGVSFVVLSATLTSVGLPIEGLGFILGVDRLMDMGRTVVNVIGNALATLVIAKWENQFDEEKAKQYEAEFLKK